MSVFEWDNWSWDDGHVWGPVPPHPPLPLATIIPAYPYQQYADDPYICAFFAAFNTIAQSYLDWFNETGLAVYTLPSISGALLDWIGRGIYGIPRPVFSSLVTQFIAGYNSVPYDVLAYNANISLSSGSATIANDDFYKRVLTWWNYLGNGRFFNVPLLRWRVARFIYGANGSDATLAQAQTIHILAGVLPPPPAPTLGYVPGGSIGTTSYGARASYITPRGETLAGPASILSVPANNLLVVDSPPAAPGVTGWNVYAAKDAGLPAHFMAGYNALPYDTFAYDDNNAVPVNWQKQNTSVLAIGTNWIEPSSGLINGGPPPAVNTSNIDTNLIISVPAGIAATYFQEAFEQGILAYPFQLTGDVVIV